MKAKISVRQICFILIAYTAVSKLIFYPTMLSYYAERDLLISALVDFVIQGVVIWSVSYLASRTDKTFFGLLEGRLGNIAARVIYALFALFFILCTVIPLFEQKVYIHAIFYETVPSMIVILPIFFFTVYAASKGLENIGRCADICLPIFLVGMVFILAMSFGEVEWDSFLPIMHTPPERVFGASLATAFRFCEPCWLLMLLGHFKYKRGDAAKLTLSYAAGAVFVLAVLAAFYGIYGDIAASRQFAISKISLFFPAMEIVGRIDFIALYALEIVMLFSLVLNMQLAVHCLEKCTGYKNRALLSAGVNLVFVILVFTLENKLSMLHSLWSQWMWIANVMFAVLIPLAAWALVRRGKA